MHCILACILIEWLLRIKPSISIAELSIRFQWPESKVCDRDVVTVKQFAETSWLVFDSNFPIQLSNQSDLLFRPQLKYMPFDLERENKDLVFLFFWNLTRWSEKTYLTHDVKFGESCDRGL